MPTEMLKYSFGICELILTCAKNNSINHTVYQYKYTNSVNSINIHSLQMILTK